MLPLLIAALPREAPIASLELFCLVKVVPMLREIQGLDALQSIKCCNVERFLTATTTTEEDGETRSPALVPNDTFKSLQLLFSVLARSTLAPSFKATLRRCA